MSDSANHAPPSLLCGRTLTGNPLYFPQSEYHGQTVYFCTEYCLRAFLEDPERFYPAHSKQSINPQTCEFNREIE